MLKEHMPQLVERLEQGFASMERVAGEPLADIPPVVQPILTSLELPDALGDAILEAFAEEPGDRIWHLVNAVSAAANVVARHASRPSLEVLTLRRQLQQAAMALCSISARGRSRSGALAHA